MAAWRSKSKEWDMGDYNATLEENEARLWCIRNNIYISPFAKQPGGWYIDCLLYTSPSPRDGLLSRMPSSA